MWGRGRKHGDQPSCGNHGTAQPDELIKAPARYLTNPDTGVEQFALAKVEHYQYVGRLVDVLI